MNKDKLFSIGLLLIVLFILVWVTSLFVFDESIAVAFLQFLPLKIEGGGDPSIPTQPQPTAPPPIDPYAPPPTYDPYAPPPTPTPPPIFYQFTPFILNYFNR